MLKLYERKSSISGEKLRLWLNNHNIHYVEVSSKDLVAEDIKNMLCVSEKGFETLLVPNAKKLEIWRDFVGTECVGTSRFERFTTSQMIQVILVHPKLLRSPILFDNKRLLIGFHLDEVRVFLSRKFREEKRKK